MTDLKAPEGSSSTFIPDPLRQPLAAVPRQCQLSSGCSSSIAFCLSHSKGPKIADQSCVGDQRLLLLRRPEMRAVHIFINNCHSTMFW